MPFPKSDEPLPPFGIRDLHGPLSKAGIVKISESQYDATLRSQPDASLSYLDDDDGEQITIGSSLELKQRLDDPVPEESVWWTTTRDNSQENPLDGDKIHIFDIRHTSGSLAVWREHEAYSSKLLRNGTETSSDNEETHKSSSKLSPVLEPIEDHGESRKIPQLLDSSTGSATEEFDAQKTPLNPNICFKANSSSLSKPNPWNPQNIRSFVDYTNVPVGNTPSKEPSDLGEQHQERCPALSTSELGWATTSETQVVQDADQRPSPERPQHTPNNFDQVLTEALQGLDTHIKGFADFLDLTADSLRCMAQKNKDTDSTPVDKIFDGFKLILTEVGEFGLDIIRNLDSEPGNLVNSKLGTGSQESFPNSNFRSEIGNIAQDGDTSRPQKQVNFVGIEKTSKDHHSLEPAKGKLVDAEKAKKAAGDRAKQGGAQRRVRSSSAEEWNPLTDVEPLAALSTFGVTQHLPEIAQPSTSRATSKKLFASPALSDSILDLDTSDPEFSIRYPPLPSLYRSDLSDRMKQRPKSISTEPLNTAATSAFSKYPSLKQLEGKGHRVRGQYDGSEVLQDSLHYQDSTENTRRYSKVRTPISKNENAGRNFTEDTVGVKSVINRPAYRSYNPVPTFSDGPNQSYHRTHADNNLTDLTDLENCYQRNGEALKEDVLSHSIFSSSRRLPGAWPENRTDEISTLLQSSGQPLADESNRNEIEHAPGSQVIEKNFPELSCRSNSPLADPYSHTKALRRAHTVNFSNPAARLTKPFDPLRSNSRPVMAPERPGKPHLTINATPIRPKTKASATTLSAGRGPTLYTGSSRPQPESLGLSTDPSATLINNLSRLSLNDPRPNPQSVLSKPLGQTQDSSSSIRQSYDAANHFPRPMRSLPNFASAAPLASHTATAGTTIEQADSHGIDECVKKLRWMGFGQHNPTELARLYAYATAAAGDVTEAVDIIEEDRNATKTWSLE